MKILLFLVFLYIQIADSAEYPIVRLIGEITFVNEKVICIGSQKNEHCIRRTKANDSKLNGKNKNQNVDILIEKKEILEGR